jgi:uncharacterized membrane protein
MSNNKKTKLNKTLKAIRSFEGNFAQWITRISGSMWFIYFHALWFAFWILANEGLFAGISPFDPFPYGLLTMIVSLEAIFLSAFIMVAQNRMELLDTYRDIEEDIEEAEDEREVQDIQKDLDDIKVILNEITKKLPRETQPKKE